MEGKEQDGAEREVEAILIEASVDIMRNSATGKILRTVQN